MCKRAAREAFTGFKYRLSERLYSRNVARHERDLIRNPEDTTLWRNLAKLHESHREHQAASNCYRRMAMLFQARGQVDEAASCYRQILHLGCPEPARVYRDLTVLYAGEQRFDEAASTCRRVVEIYLAEGHRTAAIGYLRTLPAYKAFAPSVRAELDQLLEQQTGRQPSTASLPRLPAPPSGSPMAPARASAISAAPRTGSAEQPPRQQTQRVFLQGLLGQIAIFDVVQIVESNAITGRLEAQCGAQRGILHFNAGRIVAAELADGSTGQEALKAILVAESGVFKVELCDCPAVDEFHAHSNTGLLVEVLRVIDEERRDELEGARCEV